MAEIGHVVVTENTVASIASTTYTTFTGREILGSALDGNADYLLIFIAGLQGEDVAANDFHFHVNENGVGELAGSHARHEPRSVNNNIGHHYQYIVRVTTAATPNNYEFQGRTEGSAITQRCTSFYAVAILLDDLVEDTDFFYDLDTTDYLALDNTGWTSGASVTIGDGVDDFLVISFAHTIVDTPSVAILMRHDIGGTPNDPLQLESEDDVEEYCVGPIAYVAAPAASTVITNEFQTDSGTAGQVDVLRNAIFALRLNAFEDHAGVRDASDTALTPVDTDVVVGTLGHTTDTAAARDWMFFATALADVSSTNVREIRGRIDDSTLGNIAGDATRTMVVNGPEDVVPRNLSGELIAVADATTFDIDFISQESNNAGTLVIDTHIIGFTWELAVDRDIALAAVSSFSSSADLTAAGSLAAVPAIAMSQAAGLSAYGAITVTASFGFGQAATLIGFVIPQPILPIVPPKFRSIDAKSLADHFNRGQPQTADYDWPNRRRFYQDDDS